MAWNGSKPARVGDAEAYRRVATIALLVILLLAALCFSIRGRFGRGYYFGFFGGLSLISAAMLVASDYHLRRVTGEEQDRQILPNTDWVLRPPPEEENTWPQENDSGEAEAPSPPDDDDEVRQAEDRERATAVAALFERQGVLVPIRSPASLEPGEVCLHSAPAQLSFRRGANDFQAVDVGTLSLTDQRLVFVGQTTTVVTPLDQVYGLLTYSTTGFLVQSGARHQQELYRVRFPAEFLAFMICAFLMAGMTPKMPDQFRFEV